MGITRISFNTGKEINKVSGNTSPAPKALNVPQGDCFVKSNSNAQNVAENLVIKKETNEEYNSRLKSRYGGKKEFDSKFFSDVILDEYDRLRKTGSYRQNYGLLNITGDVNSLKEKVSTHLIPKAGTPIVYHKKAWAFRHFTLKNTDRISLNVSANPALIDDLDRLMLKKEYVNPDGKIVKVSDMTKFKYKTPYDIDTWDSREDPVTLYFEDKINDETFEAVKTVTKKYARGVIHNGKNDSPWMSVDKYPTKQMLKDVVKDASCVDEALCHTIDEMFSNMHYDVSSGIFEACQNVIKEFSDFKKL